MGNSCPSNCLYSCCDINYYCTTNTRNFFSKKENCQYYYYDYTWVYWSVSISVFFIFFFFFLWLFICIRRRRNLALGTTQPMIVENTSMTTRSPMTTNRQYNMYDGNVTYNSNPQNYNGQQMYSNQQNYGNGFNTNQYNRNIVQGIIFY